jgi:multidrug transporter EmrE-like cation transporter
MNTKGFKTHQINDIIHKLMFNPFLIGGCLCYGLSLVFYCLILQKMNLNIAYPIAVSGSVLLVTVISSLILFEPLKIINVFGIIMILFGIFLIVR